MNNLSLKSLPYYMRELKHSLDSYVRRALEEYGVTETEGKYLHVLYFMDKESLTSSDLSRFTHFDKAHTSRCMSMLRDKGLIEIDDSKTRNVPITLSEDGKLIAKKIDSIIFEWEEMVTRDIDPKDAEGFVRTLGNILDKAKNI